MIWHSHTAEEALQELQSDRQTGLTAGEAAVRLEEYGANRLEEGKTISLFRRFLRQLKDGMVIILMIAAAVSLAVCLYDHYINGKPADWIDPVVIVAIVLLNAVLGAVQESRAEAALAALRDLSAPTARVRRDGTVSTVPADTLVPGDVVELEAGDLVPADCRLLEAHSLRCNESALTGESVPAEKAASPVYDDITVLADRTNMLYAGCAVTNGKALGLVVATGMQSEMGHVASLLKGEEEGATPLQRNMAQLSKYLGLGALAVCGIIFVVGLCFKLPLLSMFMTAVSLAVAAIPEGLPAIVTIVLALGVQRMVEKHAIIRRLPAVETLGCASVICSDKTGTLTQNRMTLRQVFCGHRLADPETESDEGVFNMLQMAALCTDAVVTRQGEQTVEIGDPTETAILVWMEQHGVKKDDLLRDMPLLGELPFDSERKRMTTVHRAGEQTLVIVKGAPELLFPLCVRGHIQQAAAANETMAGNALRVLAIAYKLLEAPPAELLPEELECDLTLAGLVGLIDPPRPEVRRAVEQCDTAGIRTVMITGDNVVTASAIARELGILHEGEEALTGAQLAALPEEKLEEHIERYRVYARVTPADKIRIVKAWQSRGKVVAMTGDGINDAPALKAADIGCAMGVTGTDVAKGAADMTLTDDNFSTIVAAVREGRGIYDNIRKAVRFLLSCNLGEIATVFLSMLFWRESPLLPIQLLWLNLITDSLPALALGLEPVEPDVMERAPRDPGAPLLSRRGWVATALQGGMFALITLIAYFVGSRVWGSVALGETMAFAVLSLSQLIHACNMRSSHSLFRVGLGSNRPMLGAFAVSLLLMLAVLLIPGVQGVFSVVAMSGRAWGLVAGLSLAPFPVMELTKLLRRLSHRSE